MGRKSYKEYSLKTRKVLVCVFIALLAAITFALVVNCYSQGNQAVYGATTETAADYADVVPEGKARLLLGNENLSDEDAYIICIYGDGFMINQQEKFFNAAKNNAEYIMKQSPLDELAPLIKIYAVGVVSNTDAIPTGSVAADTYFQTHFNVNGIDRLMGYSGGAKLNKLNKVFCPYYDQIIILANTLKYGGSGSSGGVALVSLAAESRDIFVHEFGHSAAKLGDEYWQAGYEYECANKTKQSDPEKVRWKRFIGLNGIGVYPFSDQPSGGDRYYKPSLSCKMYSLASSEFCEVCKEELRKWLCKKSNITMLFFQKYADEIRVGRYGKDMSEYFIFRKGENEITGDKITKGLTLTYYSADGTVLDEAPNTPGRYKVKASFTGNDIYDACEQVEEYEVLPRLPLIAESKIYDGEPAYVDYVPENADGYTHIKYTYSGKIIYSDTYTENYDSAEPPVIPGEYTVKAQAMNSSGCLEEKTADFVIEHRQNAIVQNRMPRNNDAEKTINYDEVLPWQQELYRTRNIIFAGEGFTAAEQDKFEKLARRATYALRTSKPYSDFRNYVDFYYVNTVSKTSGLGSDAYFGLSADNSGKIVSSARAFSVSNFLQEKYFSELISMGGRDEFSICIVLVNDVKALSGARDINEECTRLTIYVPANQDGIDYAVKELANTIIGKDEGYMPSSAAEKAEYVKLFRASFFYRHPSAQCPFIADDYNQTFAYTGSPIDFSDYFHVYIEGTAFDNSQISQYFSFTYYADENGYPGEKLATAPYKVGTYFIRAQLMPTKPGYSMDAWSDVTNRVEYLITATAFTRYHIAASGVAVDDGYDDYIDFGGNVGELCEHVFGEWQNEVAADCTHTGIKAHKDCTLCNRHFDADGNEIRDLRIPARHTLKAVPKQDSTCTAQGTLAHEHCSVCGKDFIDGAEKSADELIIAATGHSYGGWSIVKPATCSAAGSKKRICTKCNHEEIQIVAIDANAHTWGEWTIDKAATCTEKGEKTRVCSHNSTHRQTQEIAAAGHSWNPEATRVEPTCTANGYVRGTCMVCGTTTTEVLPALGHELAQHAAKAATCTEIGWNAYETCLHCDYTTYSEIAATGHSYGGWSIVKSATCSAAGSKTRICTKCNHEEIQIVAIDVNAHTWGEWTIDKAATCTEKGEKTRVCSHNSTHRQTQEIAAAGHSWNPEATRVEPTCTANGYIRGTCMVCGTTTTEVLPARGHELAQHAAKAATCTEIGWNAYETCLHCDYTTYFEIAATGHTEVGDAAVLATCAKKGMTAGSHCSVCNKVITAQNEIPALGHDYDNEFTVDKQPTVTEKGSKSKHCSRCDSKTQVTEIDMLKAELVKPDKNGGEILVSVSTPDGFSPDTELVVTEIAEDNYTDYNAVAETVNGEIAFVYDVMLKIDGVSVQPGGTLTIKLRIPENILGKEFKLFHLHDGMAVDMEYTVDGVYAILSTDNLSEFIFVSEKTIEPNSDNTLPVASIAGIAIGALIAVLIGICTVYYFVTYRKRRYGR